MNKFETKILIGRVKNSLVFADIEVLKDKTLEVSFLKAKPFWVNEKYLKERLKEYVSALGAYGKVSLLEIYDCRPSELIGILYNEMNIDEYIILVEFLDEFSIEGYKIRFEEVPYIIFRDDSKIDFIDAEFFKQFYEIVKGFNFTVLDEEMYSSVKKLLEEYKYHYDNIETEEYIIEFLNEWVG